MSYYTDGISECWPERTLGEALEDQEPEESITPEDFDADDALADFWAWTEKEYPNKHLTK